MRIALIVLVLLAADVLLAVGVGRFIRAGQNLELDEIDRARLRRINPSGGVAQPTIHYNSPERASGATPAEK